MIFDFLLSGSGSGRYLDLDLDLDLGLDDLAELIRQDPGFDVNVDQDGDGCTLLHFACYDSKRSAVIPLLLAHPDIDVNVKDNYGCTPFIVLVIIGRPPVSICC